MLKSERAPRRKSGARLKGTSEVAARRARARARAARQTARLPMKGAATLLVRALTCAPVRAARGLLSVAAPAPLPPPPPLPLSARRGASLLRPLQRAFGSLRTPPRAPRAVAVRAAMGRDGHQGGGKRPRAGDAGGASAAAHAGGRAFSSGGKRPKPAAAGGSRGAGGGAGAEGVAPRWAGMDEDAPPAASRARVPAAAVFDKVRMWPVCARVRAHAPLPRCTGCVVARHARRVRANALLRAARAAARTHTARRHACNTLRG
jgi:hypothetical protein